MHSLCRRRLPAIILLLAGGLLAGCGQKGDLYLPEESAGRMPAPAGLTQPPVRPV